jgi:hypothetical protein
MRMMTTLIERGGTYYQLIGLFEKNSLKKFKEKPEREVPPARVQIQKSPFPQKRLPSNFVSFYIESLYIII